MDVFVIPVGRDRYELYGEQPAAEDDDTPADLPPRGLLANLKHRFSVMLRAAEERQRRGAVDEAPKGWLGRLNDRVMAWVVERIAEQRLLWSLRKETAVVAAHPQDMPFEQVLAAIHRTLQRDYDRHRRWLVADSIFLVLSGALMLVPGPNLVAYYFAFRVVGHWLSMRGADQGLKRIAWSGRPCPPLTELRELAVLEPRVRLERIDDIASRLRLQHLSTFFERVAMYHA